MGGKGDGVHSLWGKTTTSVWLKYSSCPTDQKVPAHSLERAASVGQPWAELWEPCQGNGQWQAPMAHGTKIRLGRPV